MSTLQTYNLKHPDASGNQITFTSAGSVGIGTTSASNQGANFNNLVVGNTSGNNGITVLTGSNNDGIINFNNADDSDLTGYLIYEHSTDSLRFGTAGTGDKMRISSSGNVAIGTDNAISILHTSVNTPDGLGLYMENRADAGTDDKIGIAFVLRRSGGYAFHQTRIRAVKENAWTGTPSSINSALTFSTYSAESADERMRLDSSGRLLVGVSTASSSAPLIQAQGPSTGDSAGRIVISRGSSGIGTSTGTKWGELQFENNGSLIAGRISCEVDAAVSAGESPGRLIFSTAADGASSPTERMRITNGGFIKGSSSKGLQLNGYQVSLNNSWNDLDDWSIVGNKGGGGSILAITSNHTGTASGKISLTHHYIKYDGGIGHSIQVQTQFPVELRSNNGKLQLKGFDSGTGLNTGGYVTLIYSDSRQHIDN